MIGKSFPELVFIRLAIACIRLVTPLSIAYLAADCYVGRILVSPVLALYALAEALFYSAVFCPRRIRMQKVRSPEVPLPHLSLIFRRQLHTLRPCRVRRGKNYLINVLK